MDPAPLAVFRDTYESTRERSIFNRFLIVRRKDEPGVSILTNDELVRRTAEGTTIHTDVDHRSTLLAFGYSKELVDMVLS